MNSIRLLSPNLINKIAAGEVVERPASIIKELVENSIDAKAKHISIKVEKGGINLIEVADDGVGMNTQDAKLAFIQHATSKIYSDKDLKNIFTLGFRGEALASISSIASIKLHTKTTTDDPVLILIENEQILTKAGPGRNRGTSIIVQDVFSKIPARKKFLKSDNVEFKHILSTFLKLALINNKIGFKLYNNNKSIYDLQPREELEQRILDIYPNLKDKLINISYSDKSMKLSGFIGHPSMNRKDKQQQYIFVNSRPINDIAISQAIKTGYGTNLMHNQHPVYLIALEIDPEKIDVNIHPRKNEIRFDDTQQIFRTIFNSVRIALEKRLSSELKERFKVNDKESLIPSTVVTNDTKATIQERSLKKLSYLNKKTELSIPSPNILTKDKGIGFTKALLNQTQEIFDKAQIAPLFTKALQVFNTYIITEIKNQVYIVDQHAADERINYEKTKSRFQKHKTLPSQRLLIPEQIQIEKVDYASLLENKSMLFKLGFEFDLKSNHLILNSIPEMIISKKPTDYFQEILISLGEYGKIIDKEENKLINKMIATIACHSSIRAGQELEDFQIRTLLTNLLECKQPYSCPHGRPVIWVLTKDELEKNFKRKT